METNTLQSHFLKLTMLALLFPILSFSQKTVNPIGARSHCVAKDTSCPVPDVLNLPIVSGECSAEVTMTPAATNYVGVVVTGTTSDPLSYFVQGSYIIHWTYDNGNGHPSFQEQNVIVQDISAPVPDMANLPDITSECYANITTIPTAMDNCVGAVIATTADPLFYTAQGAYIIHWIYDDGIGN